MAQAFHDFLQWLKNIDSLTLERLADSATAVILLWLLQKLLLSFAERSDLKAPAKFKTIKAVRSLHKVLLAFVLWQIWFLTIKDYLTYFGLLSAGIAVALKDPIANFFGWFFILWRHPFQVGDRIEINGIIGDVSDIRLFSFSLVEIGNWVQADQITGRVIRMPNSKIFTETVTSYTKGFGCIWNEIPITVTFESNWRQAKQILAKTLEKYIQNHPCDAGSLDEESYVLESMPRSPEVYSSPAAHGIVLTMRYLCDARKRRSSTQAVWEAALENIAEHADIHFAYPAQRIYIAENPSL